LLVVGLLVLVVGIVFAGVWGFGAIRVALLERELEPELAAFYADPPARATGTDEGLAIDHHLAALELLTRLTSEAAGAGVPLEGWGAWAYERAGPPFEKISAGARCREIGLLPYAKRGVVDCPIEQQGLTLAGQLVEQTVRREASPARAIHRCLGLLRLTGDLGRSAHASFQTDLHAMRARMLRVLEDLASRDLPAGLKGRMLSSLREDLAARSDLWTLVSGEYLARQVAFLNYLDQGAYGAPDWAKVPHAGLMGETGDADRGAIIDAWRAWRAFGAELRDALAAGDPGPSSDARARFREATVLERLKLPGGTLATERRLRAREDALVERLAKD
ncbi:MAG: hypothetical protein ACYTF8_13380, partial [Planctomycetota bacterium]